MHPQFGHNEGRIARLLVRAHVRKYFVVQGRGGTREEVHAAVGRAEAARHRTGFHVQATHVRSLQSRWQECIQSTFT